jgi:hypothetical protein
LCVALHRVRLLKRGLFLERYTKSVSIFHFYKEYSPG